MRRAQAGGYRRSELVWAEKEVELRRGRFCGMMRFVCVCVWFACDDCSSSVATLVFCFVGSALVQCVRNLLNFNSHRRVLVCAVTTSWMSSAR